MAESGSGGDAQSVQTTLGKESDGEGSESGGTEVNISWLFAESPASITSVGSDKGTRLEQLQVGQINEAFHSAFGEVQVEMNKMKTAFVAELSAELKLIGDREIDRVKEAIASERSVGQQPKLKSQLANKTQAQLEVEYPLGTRVKVFGSSPFRNVSGTVRYVGELEHRREDGVWIGVELDKPKWTHNGTLEGVEYFHCRENCGIFVSPERVSRIESSKSEAVEVLKKSKFPLIGTRVEVDAISQGQVSGTVMFVGKTEFADGMWIGVALDQPKGKHNGTYKGVEYFSCKENCGKFVRRHRLTWTEQSEGQGKEPNVGEGASKSPVPTEDVEVENPSLIEEAQLITVQIAPTKSSEEDEVKVVGVKKPSRSGEGVLAIEC